MLNLLAKAFMTATRTEPESERDHDLHAAWRTRCRRAIEEEGYTLARAHGDCPG